MGYLISKQIAPPNTSLKEDKACSNCKVKKNIITYI